MRPAECYPGCAGLDWPTVTDPFRLDGRTVVVTGASRGIGAEVARASPPGAAAWCWSPARRRRWRSWPPSCPGPSAVVAGDVADTEIAAEAVAAAEELGGLWGLVNNAGINPHYHPVTETPLSEWDEVLRVNLLGAAAFARGRAGT